MASQTGGLCLGASQCRSRRRRCCLYCLWMQSGKDCIRRLSDAVMVLTPHIQTYALLIHFLRLLPIASLSTVMKRIQNVSSLSCRLSSRILMELPLVAAHVHVYTRPMSPLVYLITTCHDPNIPIICEMCDDVSHKPMATATAE